MQPQHSLHTLQYIHPSRHERIISRELTTSYIVRTTNYNWSSSAYPVIVTNIHFQDTHVYYNKFVITTCNLLLFIFSFIWSDNIQTTYLVSFGYFTSQTSNKTHFRSKEKNGNKAVDTCQFLFVYSFRGFQRLTTIHQILSDNVVQTQYARTRETQQGTLAFKQNWRNISTDF